MPQSAAGAVLPLACRASVIKRWVLDGKPLAFRHIDTVLGLLAVSDATGWLPPKAAITSSTLLRTSRLMADLLISNSLKFQAPNSFDTKKFEIRAVFLSMTGKDPRGKFAPTAIRLRVIRRASAYPTPALFSKFLGISLSRLSNCENGFPISRGLQDLIVANMPTISRSYLMDGDEDALTGFTLQKLRPLIEEESDTTRPRSRSKAGSVG